MWFSAAQHRAESGGTNRQINDGHTAVQESVYSTVSAFDREPQNVPVCWPSTVPSPDGPHRGQRMIAMVGAVPKRSGEMDWFSPYTLECLYTHMGSHGGLSS